MNILTKFLLTVTTLFCIFAYALTQAATIEEIKADMGLNEAPLLNAPNSPWAKQANITMGNAPRGDATPTWWLPTNSAYKSTAAYTGITPWFVIFPAVGNVATNSRVKVWGITLYLLDKTTNQWRAIFIDSNASWSKIMNFNLSSGTGTVNQRVEPDGHMSYKLNATMNPIHGGVAKVDLTKYINPANVGAIYAKVNSQLIPDNPKGINDLANAKITLTVGLDYYPNPTTSIADLTPTGSAPPSAVSRFGLVKPTVRTHYLANIDTAAVVKSTYTTNGGKVTIPVSQFTIP